MRLFAWNVFAVLFAAVASPQSFRLAEATIDDVHAALEAGDITCRSLVEQYLESTLR